MKKQMIIAGWRSQILTALYEEESLCELWLEPANAAVKVGDIYIGKVKHIVPNIQAAFLEIRPGVMGYYSLAANPRHFFVNTKKNDKLVAGDEILVQVEKENLKTKAWTLTGQFNLPGRYVVLKTGNEDIQISSKIKSEKERTRLKEAAFEFKEEIRSQEAAKGLGEAAHGQDGQKSEVGWMLRTEAENTETSLIQAEMRKLLVDYNNIMSIYRSRTCFSKLYSGNAFYMQVLQEIHGTDECRVTTDFREIYEELNHQMLPENITLKYYDDPSYSLIKLKGIETQIEKAQQQRVWLKSGAYLVIEPTEALTVIDVNTGKAIGKQNMEENFFKINMEAAREVCRQLRLRNISGIIIVDFINMKKPEHLRRLMDCLRAEAAKDRVQTTIVDRTALHLVEITRKKVRRPLREQIKQLNQ